ncbi:thioesterase II family protein [Paenibacillus sp. SYP-B4298]|uniref:thioesterase II family protein n=1 Tax=Paenibacillus sp. SYP-B4298 TaxID=2996034 RepID=UPI0022DE7EFE|nr:alpha/beta fold hydrolase [Paenibacillus sp. SYP-B4298]
MKKTKLFCLPFAGGSARSYTGWKKHLHPDIELIAVELAGRGGRAREAFYPDFREAVKDVEGIIKRSLNEGDCYALFGHSMGGLLAYELYDKLPRAGMLHLFVSGLLPPHCETHRERLGALDEDALIQEMKEMGGIPNELFDIPGILDMIMPVIRSDFDIFSRYVYQQELKIHCPLSILYGVEDPLTRDEVKQWSRYVSNEGQCRYVSFAGGHFFIQEQEEQVLRLINETLAGVELMDGNS